jgi:hypothetical protein
VDESRCEGSIKCSSICRLSIAPGFPTSSQLTNFLRISECELAPKGGPQIRFKD